MRRVARWAVAHRLVVLVVWLAFAAGLFMVSSAVGSKSATNFSMPGTGSQQAQDLLQSKFPTHAGDIDQIVFESRTGSLSQPATRASIDAMLARVEKIPHITGVVSPYSAAQHALSKSGKIGFATVTFAESAKDVPASSVNRLITTAESIRSASLDVQLGGGAVEGAQGVSISSATFIGVGAAVLILLISFGSFSAMLLPIVTAIVGLLAGLGLISLVSHAMSMVDFASQVALMLGLGVGIDYAMFVVTRFREAFRSNGGDVPAAVESAMNTAGRAVLFAGATVVVAQLGLLALGVSLLNGVAVASAIAVTLVMAASVTLLPALLGVLGARVGRQSRRQRTRGAEGSGTGFWRRWVGGVQRRPALTALAATAILVVLALPVLGMWLGTSDAGNDPRSSTTRQAYDLLAKGFGPGFNGPLAIAVSLPTPHDSIALSQLEQALRSTPGVASVEPAQLNQSGTTASVTAYPTTSPQSRQTEGLVNRLRDQAIPPVERATGARVYVGGQTATQVDFAHELASKQLLFMAVVIGVAALLLLVVFRSLVIPFQAAIMNLASIGAALGIMQAIFERGWLASLFGTQAGPIDASLPVMVFAIVFGLSMDYEVFLISRIHEEWSAGRSAREAITEGVARTGRVITAAAAVMIAVFASFAAGGARILEMPGVAFASAVFLDAVVVRMLLLPAVLQLCGEATWWLPAWLEPRLPHLNIEAPSSTLRPNASRHHRASDQLVTDADGV
jgi:RND superfamily putative drug exporter